MILLNGLAGVPAPPAKAWECDSDTEMNFTRQNTPHDITKDNETEASKRIDIHKSMNATLDHLLVHWQRGGVNGTRLFLALSNAAPAE